MSIFQDIIKFIATIIVLFWIPGYYFVRFMKKSLGFAERTVLSISVGIIVVPQLYFYLETLRLHNIFLVFVAAVSIIYILYNLYKLIYLSIFLRRKIIVSKMVFGITKNLFFLGLIILFVLGVVWWVVGPSGLIYDNGMRFYQANAFDSVLILSMIGELSKNPPHQSPLCAGLHFKGFHVGAFYWRAIIQKVTEIDALDLFFRFCPTFVIPLIILAAFISIRHIIGSRDVALLAIFLIFLMTDLSFLFPIADRLLPHSDITTIGLGGNFLVDFIFNPPVAHGVLIFFVGCYFLKDLYKRWQQNGRWIYVLFIGFLFGILFEYKAYMCVAVLTGLISAGIKEYLFDKKSMFLKISIFAIPFAALSFFRISADQHIALFNINVGFYPLSIFEQIGMLGPAGKAGFFIFISAFILYLTGTLGVKIFGFCRFYEYCKSWKELSGVTLFMMFAMLFSFVFTHTLVLNSFYIHGTYDFFSIFTLVLSILAAEVIVRYASKLNRYYTYVFFTAIIILGLGSTMFSFLGYFPKYSRYKVISKDMLKAIDYIRKNTSREVVILHYNDGMPKPWISQTTHKKIMDGEKGRDCFISAMTQRPTVLECSWHMRACRISSDLSTREDEVRHFFEGADREAIKHILDKYKIDYVWLENSQKLHFQTKGLLKIVFYNDEIKIYKRI